MEFSDLIWKKETSNLFCFLYLYKTTIINISALSFFYYLNKVAPFWALPILKESDFMRIWNKINLKQKILGLFIPLNIFSILLILVVSVSVIVRNSKAEMIQNVTDKIKLVGEQSELIISNAKYNIKAFSTSSALQNSISENYKTDAYGSYLFYSAMHTSIYSIMDIETLISSGYIHTYDNKIYNIKEDTINYTPSDSLLNDYQTILSYNGQIILRPPMEVNDKSALNISKSLIDITTGKCLGILSFDIKENLFYDSYNKISDSKNEEFLITDSDGRVLSAQNRSLLGHSISTDLIDIAQKDKSDYEIRTLNNVKKLVMSVPVNGTDYHVICLVPYKSIFQNALDLVKILALIGAIVLLTTFCLAQLLAISLVKPLKKLMLYADKVGQGSLDMPLVHNSSDEIGLLADNFYNMVQNIKSLTQSIYNEQNNKREYELRLLQAQINPHFLYNCLDNIITLIESKENQTATSMVHHLGRYYRLILSKGKNIITIDEELQLVKDYLEIQLIKKPDFFTYHIQIDESIKKYKIHKMILQPIVENSVIHGFSNTNIKNMIDIQIFIISNDVVIEIKDNGCGIPQSTLEQIFTPKELTIPRHFGLRNIHERIQLKYGTQYGLTITSREDLNTITTITFPKSL